MITPDLRIILTFLTSIISVVFLIPKLSRIATKIGLVDQPGKRKMHNYPRPLVGGLAMVISATFSFLLFIPLTGLRGYFVGVAILLLIGFLDDYREIGHREKFLAQILAISILMYLSRIYLHNFGNLIGLGDIKIPGNPFFIWAVTVFCTVGVINAINLIDGLDGLAGGFSFIAFLTFAAHASLAGNTTVMLLNIALIGAVLGFLRFNWKNAKVFMGDAGSLCLGFSLTFMALALTQGEESSMSPVAALLILAVPIVDTLTVMSKRIMRGESPFKPDRYHLHHIFIRYGMSKDWAVKIILGICGIFCGISLLDAVYDIPEWFFFFIFAAYFIGYIISSFYIIYMMRIGKKFLRKRQIRQDLLHSENKSEKITPNIKGLKYLRLLRKSDRHHVDLNLKCSIIDADEKYLGNVINISTKGLMAKIPHLKKVVDEVKLQIHIEGEKLHSVVKVRARHIWLSHENESYIHGFEFIQLDENDKETVEDILTRVHLNSN